MVERGGLGRGVVLSRRGRGSEKGEGRRLVEASAGGRRRYRHQKTRRRESPSQARGASSLGTAFSPSAFCTLPYLPEFRFSKVASLRSYLKRLEAGRDPWPLLVPRRHRERGCCYLVSCRGGRDGWSPRVTFENPGKTSLAVYGGCQKCMPLRSTRFSPADPSRTM